MATKPMPLRLKAVLACLIFSVAINLYFASWFAAALGVLLVYFVFQGNDSARRYLIGVSWIGLAFSAVGLIFWAAHGMLFPMLVLPVHLFGVIRCVFVLWAAQQDDVRDYMFRKSMKLDELGIDDPSPSV
jgi:hypothetical protein